MEKMTKEFVVGDQVVARNYDRKYLTKIKKVTKTLYVTDDNLRYNKETLKRVGKNYHGLSIICELTKEIVDVIEKNNCINKLKNTNWEKFALTKLQEIIQYIEKQEGE